MPTRKEDNDDERQARIDAMVEMHQRRLDRSNKAKVLVHRAQVRARLAQALASNHVSSASTAAGRVSALSPSRKPAFSCQEIPLATLCPSLPLHASEPLYSQIVQATSELLPFAVWF